MTLDKRLQAVADFVPKGCKVADIGTDHGYLAKYLYEQDNSRYVIAADLNAGPCEAARKTFAEFGLEDKIPVRQGSGLEPLSAGEVDTVCIAGMGGKLIADILAGKKEIFAGLKTAVLQPQNAARELREWLLANDWHVADETLAKVDGRVYQIIKAENGISDDKYTDIELLVGPKIIKKRSELFEEHIIGIRTGFEKVVEGLSKVKDLSNEQNMKLQETKEKIKELNSLL